MKTLSDKRKTVDHRLAIIEGQIERVRSMVENGARCMDIIHQSQSIQGALKTFDEAVLRHHVAVHLPRAMKTKSAEALGQEFVTIYKRL